MKHMVWLLMGLFLIIAVTADVSTAGCSAVPAPNWVPGMWWSYAPAHGGMSMIGIAGDVVTRATGYKVVVLGEANVADHRFYVVEKKYSTAVGPLVEILLSDPSRMATFQADSGFAQFVIKHTVVMFPLRVGEKWTEVAGITAQVKQCAPIKVPAGTVTAVQIEYSQTTGLAWSNWYSPTVSNYVEAGFVHVDRTPDEILLTGWGRLNSDNVIAAMYTDLSAMAKFAPMSALVAAETLSNYGPDPIRAHKFINRLMKMGSSNACLNGKPHSVIYMYASTGTSCQLQCVNQCDSNYFWCRYVCSYHLGDPFCPMRCMSQYNACKKNCCRVCNGSCILNGPVKIYVNHPGEYYAVR